ncbi:hypothetical protein KR018_012652 [Drosophila ironensis]|nr:hypothetical protein KR018_012652 [Drosophila ironensis]
MAVVFQGFALLILALISGGHGSNILGLFAGLSPSHLIIQLSMARILAESGHNVTVLTVLEPPFLHKDITYIRVHLKPEEIQEFSNMVAEVAKKDNSDPITFLWGIFRPIAKISAKMSSVVKHPLFRDLYENENNKFDLVIVGYFLNYFQMALAHKLKVPQVLAISNPPSYIGYMLGNPAELSYVPSVYLPSGQHEMLSFRNRLLNVIYASAHKTYRYALEFWNEEEYRSIYGNDPSVPSYNDLTKNISLIFFASHGISEGPIRPNLPAVIEIGGIQTKEKPDPLPEKLDNFLKDTPHGAIFFSLGTNIKRAHLQEDTVQKFFNVLSKLRQKVIWKWDDLENLPGKSDNIFYDKWLPQDDILAHPSIRLFITHAGKGGITESQYHGKPMLALPVFFDQPQNAKAMEQQGFGLTQSLLSLEEESFAAGIKEILENPKYTLAARSFSSLYRDRPLSARESLIYWVNYVIRHHGAPHLQSPVVHMNWISANNLDAYAVFACVIVVLILLVKLIAGLIIRKLKGLFKKTKNGKPRKRKQQ